MTIAPVDWAAEWLRPVAPDYKMVGPILSGPGKPLPAHLEVRPRTRQPDDMLMLEHDVPYALASLRQTPQEAWAGGRCAAPCQLPVLAVCATMSHKGLWGARNGV